MYRLAPATARPGPSPAGSVRLSQHKLLTDSVYEPLQIAIHTLGLPLSGEEPSELALGGSETAVVAMARGLARAGNGVRVFCHATQPGVESDVEYRPAGQILSDLADRPCDVLLSCRHHKVLDQPLAARMIGLWNHDMPWPGMRDQHVRAFSKMSFSIFLSQFQLEEYEKAIPGIGRVGWQTTNGVDFTALESATAGVTPAGPDPVFIYGSRPERGLDQLLRHIWPRIRTRHPTARLLVSSYDLGNMTLPPELEEYYGFCRDLIEESEGVELLGSLARTAFWRQMAGCTAVLYPVAFPEVSCMVALEAQAAGVPIVTSDAFALSETVGFEETRIGAELGTDTYIEEFVATACRLVEDAEFRVEAVRRGREHVTAASHSWDALAADWTGRIRDLFRERFESQKAGVLRALLQSSDYDAARRLVAADPEPERIFDPKSLGALAAEISVEADFSGPPPDTDEAIFRIPPRPKVSATILVKNGENGIRRSIESLAIVADEILVGDTGSDDLTLEILESMGFAAATGDSSEIVVRGDRILLPVDFEDFAQARNALAKTASGDYVYWQDADEVLSSDSQLRDWIDTNVFFDALALEQRHRAFDIEMEPNHPLRCFRPQTVDGPLEWSGCVHELVEHEVNRPPIRQARVPGIYVGHFGYQDERIRRVKAKGRNLELLRRDRQLNPERRMGYILGLRECLNQAKFELLESGRLSREGYRALNLGWRIWDRHVRFFPEELQALGLSFSREILEILASLKLPLEATGEVPIQVDVSFAAQRGVLGLGPAEIPRERVFYSNLTELREEFSRRLADLERQLARGFERPVEILPEPVREGEVSMPPELFDLECDEPPSGSSDPSQA